MTTYTHPNGFTVERDEDGSLYVSAPNGAALTIRATETAAIHAAYLAFLGLWLDEETGYLVGTHPDTEGDYWISLAPDESGWRQPKWRRHGEGTDHESQALARYLATVTPPPAPQPGERWVLTLDIGGCTTEATVVEHNGETLFVFCDKSGALTVDPVSRWHRSNIRRVES